jgi:hypothetical protein
MPHEIVFVTLHIHTDGPIPGPHSLLTLSSAAHAGDGDLISTFATNVNELPGATLHPVSLEHWRTRADDWLSTRRASRPPALATSAYLRWTEKLPGEPTLVTDPVGSDHLFLYWYLSDPATSGNAPDLGRGGFDRARPPPSVAVVRHPIWQESGTSPPPRPPA